ncbi:putative galactinol--sucrose galactosyltransferase 1 [Curcuma longa]|uniref:putative galactinol--sucrose galactosyltransferase 1 n=1 Tax=Curcuma longa TaxID=136217 RepID=UPI003D9E0B84
MTILELLGSLIAQGAGWCKVGKKNLIHDEEPDTITGFVRSKDVDYLPKVTDSGWNGDSIIYSHQKGEFDAFYGLPLRHLPMGLISYAPIGLVNMFNSGGAIKDLAYEFTRNNSVISLRVRGCGNFRFYASVSPSKITVGSNRVEFAYNKDHCLVTF